MLLNRFIKSALVSTLLFVSSFCFAQNYPTRPISLIVPNPPGGIVDTSARLVSDPLGQLLQQSVIIENKPGGSGNIAYQHVAGGQKDGYSILVSYSGYHVANPILQDKLPWARKDFTPIGLVTVATNVIAVHPSIPVNNLKKILRMLKPILAN